MVLPFEHHIEACVQGEVGNGGLSPDAFARLMAQGSTAVRHIRDQLAAGAAPHFGQASRRDDLNQLADLAGEIRNRFQRVVVLGTGGSSLGGQSVVALAPRAERERLVFAENLDGRTFAELLETSDPESTLFLSISKSGSTTETIAQTLAVIGWYESQGRPGMLRTNLIAVCEPTDNVLRRIADRVGCRTLEHDPGIGGRFSVLSVTGVLPALIAGLDAQALRTGASQVFESAIADPDPAPLAGAALSVGLAAEQGKQIQVILPYVASLERTAQWHRQLWAESSGQGRARSDPLCRARTRRPAQPDAALARRAAGQVLHHHHRGAHHRRAGARHRVDRRSGAGLPQRPVHRRHRPDPGPRDHRDPGRRRAPGPHDPSAQGRRAGAWRAVHALHAGNGLRGLAAGGRSLRSAGSRDRQGADQALSRGPRRLTWPFAVFPKPPSTVSPPARSSNVRPAR
ncbi:MAG: hypothetical protein ACMVY4_09895 [Minwuia sp.]|uniref:hypothetical protein n=1 Tax=Minwuia sp. TaxID=2493630 RepID=UPI003A8B2EF6